MMEVVDKKITVLGAARSGLSTARLLKNKGARVFVSDSAEAEKKQNEIRFLENEKIPFEFDGHSERAFDCDMVVLSPGIPVRSEVVQTFLKKGTPVFSEIEIASWFCQASIIAVTGSNGKTTTTTLIGEMLKKRYPDAIVAGNIGMAFSDFVENSNPDSWAVVEVSSFQLETIDKFHPEQAVVLNFAPNHLDRYDSYHAYLKAKWRVTKNLDNSDQLIFNSFDGELSRWADKLNSKKSGFHVNGDTSSEAFFRDNAIFLHGNKLIDVFEMKLRGMHNYMNAMAAALAASNAGVPQSDIIAVLKDFSGVEHRLEFVAEKGGVKYINDSKATTVESLSFALQSFAEPIILIAGGKDKGSDFSKLNQLIRKYVKEIILIGHAAEKIAESWKGLKPIHKADTMEAAVILARDLAKNNEVVLLSPACASFDMFSDFEDRGRQFKKIVNNL